MSRPKFHLGFWIEVVRYVPAEVSPPVGGIFFAWPHEPTRDELKRAVHFHATLLEATEKEQKRILKEEPLIDDWFGYIPNPNFDVWVSYQGHNIKLHAYEYRKIDISEWDSIMKCYDLVSYEELAAETQHVKVPPTRRDAYEAALVDGCDELQALMVAYGRDPAGMPPPIGWFKPNPERCPLHFLGKGGSK